MYGGSTLGKNCYFIVCIDVFKKLVEALQDYKKVYIVGEMPRFYTNCHEIRSTKIGQTQLI